jgi:hypothetical protein
LTVTLGSLMTLLGILAFKYYFFKASWKAIYVWSTLLTSFFSLLQLVLVFQINTKYLHLNNYLFALGDDVISAYISGIHFLPVSPSSMLSLHFYRSFIAEFAAMSFVLFVALFIITLIFVRAGVCHVHPIVSGWRGGRLVCLTHYLRERLGGMCW